MNKNLQSIGIIVYWLAWPALFIYLRKTSRCRVVVSNGDSVLLIKNWLGPSQFTLPGGGLRKNEDPREGIVRELEEETGIISSEGLLKLIKPEYTVVENGYRYQCFSYSLSVKKDQIIKRQKFEIAELKWVSYKDALSKYKLSSVARELITTWLGDNHLLD